MKIFKQFATAAMTFALACPLFTACGNGPVEQDEIEDMIEEVSWKSEQNIKERNEEYSQSNKLQACYDKYYYSTCCDRCYEDYGYYECGYCYNSSSSTRSSSSSRYSSSSYYDPWDDYYPSSSSNSVSIYTKGTTTITITLDYYHQLKTMDDNGLSDGDPRIFFGIMSYRNGDRQDSVQTSTINLGDNVGTWSGSKSVTAKLSGGIDEILVCPVFTDADPFFDDHEYSSNYCYYVHDLGQKIGQTIQQDDYMATYFDLEWRVKVNYN